MKKGFIPRKYSDISLGQFLDWNDTKNEFERFCIMTKISEEEVRQLPFQEVKETLDYIQSIIDNQESAEFKLRFDLNGTAYGFIPDISQLSYGEFADLMHYTKEDNIMQNLDKAMAIFYRPINATMGKKYEIEQYNSEKHLTNAADMRELRLDYVFGVILFFSTIANDLLNDSLTYLEQATNQLVEMTKELQNEQMQ
jgi:hypothetical protein